MTGKAHMNPIFGYIFLFNLIIGTGALALPRSFSLAGWILGSLGLIAICFFSYMCASFLLEALYISDIIKKEEKYSIQNEKCPLLDKYIKDQGDLKFYNIQDKIEMGELTSIYFGRLGKYIFYLSLIIYLYGDLTIYSVAISQTLSDITCSVHNNISSNDSNPNICNLFYWKFAKSKLYHIYLIAFIILIFPFTLYQIDKTKYLQILTTIARWAAFALMIGLSSARIFDHNHLNTPNSTNTLSMNDYASNQTVIGPKLWDFKGLPSLFGIAVYAFMCHHSIPSLITTMSAKRIQLPSFWIKIKNMFSTYKAIDLNHTNDIPSPVNRIATNVMVTPFAIFLMTYVTVLIFYILLSVLACFAFPPGPGQPVIKDLFTLNFVFPQNENKLKLLLGYFLAIFPVFPLATNFPILAITLRNNIWDLMRFLTSAKPDHLIQGPNYDNNVSSGNDLNDNFSRDCEREDLNHTKLGLNGDREQLITSNLNTPPSVRKFAHLHSIFSRHNALLIRLMILGITIGPPFIIAWFSPSNLGLLVTLTGAYPGLAIQCLFPSLIIYKARKQFERASLERYNGIEDKGEMENKAWSAYKKILLKMPYKSNVWIMGTFIWVFICLTLVTIHFLLDRK